MNSQMCDFFFIFLLLKGSVGYKLFFCILVLKQMCNLITLKFGTDKERIKVNSHTKFARNLIRVHGAMSIELLSRLRGKPLMGIVCR